MTKRKKIIIAVIAAALVLAVGVCIFLIASHHKNQPQFKLEDTLPNGKGKKATVILLAGQSNASGCSQDAYLQKNVSAEQYAEYA